MSSNTAYLFAFACVGSEPRLDKLFVAGSVSLGLYLFVKTSTAADENEFWLVDDMKWNTKLSIKKTIYNKYTSIFRRINFNTKILRLVLCVNFESYFKVIGNISYYSI